MQEMMPAASTTPIIPFDSGRSYVVRGLPVENDAEYRFTDNMGRTEKDKRFLEQFERIFLAAAEGDKDECQRVIEDGYHDFDAVSFGRFGTASGKYVDGISPLKIAEMHKHFQIVELFKKALEDRKVAAAASKADAANQLEKEKLENIDLMRTQIIERELMAFHISSPAKNKDLADVQYECVKTMNKRWLCYDMSATEGERHIEAFLYKNTIEINNSKSQSSMEIPEAHQKTITGLCIQGEQFFSSSEDKTLKAWDINTGECLKTFTGHTDRVACLCVQGKLLISGSQDKTLKIWDIESGNCLKTLRGHTSTVSAVAVHGQFVVSGSWDKSVRIWNIESGESLKVLKKHNNWVNVIMIHDGLIFTGSDDHKIIIWHLETGIELNTLKGHTVGIVHLKIEDGKLISTTRDCDEIKEWVLKK